MSEDIALAIRDLVDELKEVNRRIKNVETILADTLGYISDIPGAITSLRKLGSD